MSDQEMNPPRDIALREETGSTNNMPLIGLVAACAIGFLIVDVSIVRLLELHSELLACVLFNLLVAQLTLISVWGTLVHGTFWIRMPWTLLLITVSWYALVLGYTYVHGEMSAAEVLSLGLVWFYGFVVSFVPLKIAAWSLRWKITRRQSSDDSSQFAIRDIMLGMFILSVTLAIGRLFVPDWQGEWAQVVESGMLGRRNSLVLLGTFGVVSLILKMPCIWIALAMRSDKIVRYSLIWAAYCAAVCVVEITSLCVMLGPPGEGAVIIFIDLLVGHLLMGITVLGVLLILRKLGYRLSRVRKHEELGALPQQA